MKFRFSGKAIRSIPIILAIVIVLFSSVVHKTYAAISYVGAGTAVAVGSGNLASVGIPTGIGANDILIVVLHSRDNIVSTMPADWTLKISGNGNTTNRLTVWWKRTTGTESAPTVTHSAGDSAIARMYAFSGVVASGDPFDVAGSVQSNAGSPISTSAITTSIDGDMIIHIFGSQDNNSWGSLTGTPTNDTVAVENSLGTDNSVDLAYGILATAGSTGAAGATQSLRGPDAGASVQAVLKPILVTTISNFVTSEPGNSTIAPGSSGLVDSFGLATSAGTDTVTGATVTLAAGTGARVATVAITNNGDTATYCSATPSGDTATLTGCGIPATATNTQFKIKITADSHNSMPAPPGGSYAVTGTVTAFTSTNTQSNTDSGSSTLTIDNASPWGATSVSGLAGSTYVTLNWTTSASSDFSRSVMLRWTGSSAGSEVPAEGTDYSNGNTISTATVVCVRTTDAVSTAVSGVDGAGTGGCSPTALTPNQAYTYKVFQKDSNGNYDVGVAMGTFTTSPTPTTTLGTGSDPSATIIPPEASAADVDQFTLQTNTGTETITSVTVNLSTNSGVGRLAITNSSDTELGFTTSPSTGSNTITVSSMSAGISLNTFKVRVTPLSHASMPAVPGGAYAITAPVTSFAGSYSHTGGDANANALTIDNQSPANVTSASGSPGNTQVSLSWTNPTDGDFHSTVVLRRASTAVANVPAEGTTYVVGNTIGTAIVACVVATPTAGCTDTNVSNGIAYHYKIFSKDSSVNYSETGVIPTGSPFTPTAPDTTAPAAVTNLAAFNATNNSIDLSWTAPGDDGNTGTATTYDVRYSTSLITSDNFSSATTVTGEPTPSIATSPESMTVSGLSPSTTYYFALKTSDEVLPVPNTSAISNVVSLATTAIPDTTAPSNTTDLAVESVTSGSVTLVWTAPGDDNNTGTAHSYDMRYSTSPIISGNFSSATAATGEPTPSIATSPESMTVSGLSPSTTYYFALKTSDEVLPVPNTSAISNVVSTTTAVVTDTTAPAAVTNLAAFNATNNSIDLSWTAPGDDNNTGTATTYDMRYSSSPITTANFSSASPAAGEPTPSIATSPESMTVSGLSSNTTYYFAIKTYDDASNLSAISNVVSLATTVAPDATAPAAVSNLSASSPTTSSIDLSWTAPGDDNNTGTATTYDVRYSTSPIISGNFSSATATTGEPTPSAAGTNESMTISGLSSNTTYYFALKTADEVPNTSSISNVVSLATSETPNITIPETGGGVAPTSAHFSGKAYPKSKIEILRKDAINPSFKNIPIEQSTISADGVFDITVLALLQGQYFFALRAKDRDGEVTGVIPFSVDFISENRLEARDIFVPPTVKFSSATVTKGSSVKMTGYGAPKNIVEIEIDGKAVGKAETSSSGLYAFSADTSALSTGTHSVRTRQIDSGGEKSAFSLTRIFRVSLVEIPRADFNNDNAVNITDWSIFLFNWGSGEKANKAKADMNGDGKTDISDFSIFLRAMQT